MTMTGDRTGYPDWELWLAHEIIMTMNQNPDWEFNMQHFQFIFMHKLPRSKHRLILLISLQ